MTPALLLLALAAGPHPALGRGYADVSKAAKPSATFAPLAASPKAVALIFLGTDCPISNGYAPEVGRIAREYGPRGVAVAVVYADRGLGVADARRHAADYGYPCPALLDPAMRLARLAGATVKPQAAVLSPSGAVLYVGRIDDLYVDFGKKRLRATATDLRTALDAVLAGKPAPKAGGPAIGCDINFPSAEPE